MPINKFNITKEEYFRIKSKIHPFMVKVSNHYNVFMSDLRYYHYVQYCESVLGVSYVLAPTEYDLDGFTMKDDKGIGIFINNTIANDRMHFTYAHEIIHAVFHKNNSVFASTKTGMYSAESLTDELEANVGGSLLMANDSIIEELIERRFNFSQMCTELEMSKQALHSRLINYAQYNLELSNPMAKDVVFKFRYNKNQQLLEKYEEYKERIFIEENNLYNPYDDYNPSDDYSFY